MNKKLVICVICILSTLILTVTSAQATAGFVDKEVPNAKKLYFRLEMVEYLQLPVGERDWCTPKDETLPFFGGDPNTYHVRGCEHGNPMVLNLKVGEGGSVEDLNLATVDYMCSYDMDWNFETGDAIIRIRETLTIYTDETKTISRGTLNILAVERLHNVMMSDYYGVGTFVGLGEIDGQKVKVAGSAGIDFDGMGWDGPWREGVITGWPTS